MQDPVTDDPAVLVKKNNITQQKELEIQLSVQQAALQRYAALGCTVPCYAVSCWAVPCYAVPRYAVPCCALPCHAVLCHGMLCMLCRHNQELEENSAAMCEEKARLQQKADIFAKLCCAMPCSALHAVSCHAMLCCALHAV